MQSFLRAALWLTLLAAGSGRASAPLRSAQQTESRISARVLDQSGAALPGVTVTVTSKETGAIRTDVTEAKARYTVTNLGPGTYTVTVELSGFAADHAGRRAGRRPDLKPDRLSLGVAAVTETVHGQRRGAGARHVLGARSASTSRRRKSSNLPVNGRNFANLMTLATGATRDGNGGWASVRFNGKSNQQNYLNYDGVDGTYVWDASPGYLNATGSQFRLQTSMESVAEFRVNSGLAPAESGLGAGGNITVVSKSGSNRFRGSLFEYSRDDALDSASKYDDVKQKLRARSVRRLDRRSDHAQQDLLLRQLRGPAADHRPELHRSRAERRSAPPHPRRRAGRARRRPEPRSHPRRRAAAQRVPAGHGGDVERARRPRPRWSARPSRRRTRSRSASIIASRPTSRSTSATCSATARSTRRTAR